MFRNKRNITPLAFFILLSLLSCGNQDELPSVEHNEPTLIISSEGVSGFHNSTHDILVTWTADASILHIEVNSENASLPQSFEGETGQFTSTITIGQKDENITFSITDQSNNSTSKILSVDYIEPLSLSTESYFNNNFPNKEPEAYNYDFTDPVKNTVLSKGTYDPSECNSYVRDNYGPRVLSDKYDFHQGMDITSCVTDENGVMYDDDNRPTVYSMCDGTVYRIDESNKCSIYIECDQEFNGNPEFGKVRFIYRHLESFDSELVANGIDARINKGDKVGIMGNCEANKVHLHLSCVKSNPSDNIKLARMFDIDRGAYFERLKTAEIDILQNNEESTIARFVVPGNQWGVVELRANASGKDLIYNFENITANSDGSDERDDPGFVEGMEVYTYPFNGDNTACHLYDNNKDDLPVNFPGSTKRGDGNYFPIECDNLSGTVAFVYDLVILGEVDLNELQLFITDVHGNEIRSL